MKPRELQVLIAVLVSFAICAVSVVVFFVLAPAKTELAAPQVPSTAGLSPAVLAELGDGTQPRPIETKPPIVESKPVVSESNGPEGEAKSVVASEKKPFDLERFRQICKDANVPPDEIRLREDVLEDKGPIWRTLSISEKVCVGTYLAVTLYDDQPMLMQAAIAGLIISNLNSLFEDESRELGTVAELTALLATIDEEALLKRANEIISKRADLEKIEKAAQVWNIPDQHVEKVKGFFDKSTFFEWNSASEPERTAFCLVYATLNHPGKPQKYTAGAATYYYQVIQTWYSAKGDPRSLTPKAAIEVALASQTAAEIDREISAGTRNLETTIEKQTEKKPSLVLQELKRSSIGENIRTFDYRLTNESPSMLEDVQIEIECTTIDGKYLGSTKMLIDKLAPGESIIEKAMLEADVKSHELTQIRIIGDHKDKLELTFKP